ncbi:MAG: bifunctional phosphoribosylaminoimidazolecarboxamide formyltransferase/inosine monophosphate cyclohydrolase [Acidobacteria bacterium]|nr:MAG: bifunctional phosphoribosylaminoimidazolecarboxamide formyltransferase/inosine monophosphate cyclohydrolase [Acidobacteriota bacterium]
MNNKNELGLRQIKRALISVSDKTGIIEFSRELQKFNVEIISTGGSAKALRDAGITVRDVSDVTGFPEMMDGRVKTLNPKIHGGLLGLRDNPEHVSAMEAHEIEPIDLVVVNLYPFEETVAKGDVSLEEAIEQIDIGGPAMIRSAAKNFKDVAVIASPHRYLGIIEEMIEHEGKLSLATRTKLALEAFARTAAYDRTIAIYLRSELQSEIPGMPAVAIGRGTGFQIFAREDGEKALDEAENFPDRASLLLQKVLDLRYGENPHQRAALYECQGSGVAQAELLNGKEMSFNNYVDSDAAWQLACDFDDLTCAIIKHTNPAGVAIGTSGEEAYRKALLTDPISAFGGIVAFNCPVTEGAARAVIEIFTEVIIAPDYYPGALEVLSSKKNLRVLKVPETQETQTVEYQQISGGMLVQTRDTHKLKPEDLEVVSKRKPTEEEIRSLLFAWTVCKHTKSNAIVYARDGQTVGVGAGQMSRVDSVKIGAMRAQLPVKGSVLASDAFFPFRDGIDEAAKHGITAVIQPGGSVRDEEVIAAADEHGLAMVFTGVRHFKH